MQLYRGRPEFALQCVTPVPCGCIAVDRSARFSALRRSHAVVSRSTGVRASVRYAGPHAVVSRSTGVRALAVDQSPPFCALLRSHAQRFSGLIQSTCSGPMQLVAGLHAPNDVRRLIGTICFPCGRPGSRARPIVLSPNRLARAAFVGVAARQPHTRPTVDDRLSHADAPCAMPHSTRGQRRNMRAISAPSRRPCVGRCAARAGVVESAASAVVSAAVCGAAVGLGLC
jgi:hypothetical protein